MKKTIDTTTRSVTFTFEGLDPVTMHAERMSAANYDYACLHGLAARIGDNAAIPKSAENGYTVTEAMRREAVLELVTHYEDGAQTNWNVRTAARTVKQNPAVMKYAEAAGLTYEQAMEKIAQRALDDLMAE